MHHRPNAVDSDWSFFKILHTHLHISLRIPVILLAENWQWLCKIFGGGMHCSSWKVILFYAYMLLLRTLSMEVFLCVSWIMITTCSWGICGTGHVYTTYLIFTRLFGVCTTSISNLLFFWWNWRNMQVSYVWLYPSSANTKYVKIKYWTYVYRE